MFNHFPAIQSGCRIKFHFNGRIPNPRNFLNSPKSPLESSNIQNDSYVKLWSSITNRNCEFVNIKCSHVEAILLASFQNARIEGWSQISYDITNYRAIKNHIHLGRRFKRMKKCHTVFIFTPSDNRFHSDDVHLPFVRCSRKYWQYGRKYTTSELLSGN